MPKRGENIYKRKDGRCEGRYFSGLKTDGKKKYASIYAKTYAEAKQKLTIIKAEIKPHIKEVIFKTAAQKWLSYNKQRVKDSTLENYSYLLKRHILPYFGGCAMSKIEPSLVNKFIEIKLTKGKLKQNTGISKKYMQDILSIVKSIAKFAELEYSIPYKLACVSSPKPIKIEPQILDDNEIKQLSNVLVNDIDCIKLSILIFMYTGLRIGEVCALKWCDFDPANSSLHIRRTIQRITDNCGSITLIEDIPKTANSLRVIPLPDIIIKYLKDLNSNESDYITGIEPYKLRRSFKRILKDNDMKNIRFHDLRHSFASWGLRLNFDIKSLSEILGHANAAKTLNYYAHSSIEQEQKCMNMLKP